LTTGPNVENNKSRPAQQMNNTASGTVMPRVAEDHAELASHAGAIDAAKRHEIRRIRNDVRQGAWARQLP
jgi:hypothetical protein